MDVIEERISSGNLSLQLTRYGDSKNPTIILVHGYPDNSQVWDAVIPLLVDDYAVVTYDVRGAGRSSTPEKISGYRLNLLASDLEAVIDVVSPDQPIHLVAHDWGSIQSWEAVTEPRFNHKIASFTSISGPCLDHLGKELRHRLLTPSLTNYRKTAKQLLNSWYVFAFQLPGLAPNVWRAGLDKAWPSLLQRLENIREAAPNKTQGKDGIQGINLYRANVLQRLASPRDRFTRIPVHLIVPLQDPFVKPDVYDNISQWAPNLTRSEINAGHWVQLSHPEYVVKQVRDVVAATGDKASLPKSKQQTATSPARTEPRNVVPNPSTP